MTFGHRIAPPVLSMGEPAGIGPDLILQVWQLAQDRKDIPPFAAIADPKVLELRSRNLGISVPLHICPEDGNLEAVACTFRQALPVIPIATKHPDVMGMPSVDNAAAVTGAIAHGVKLCQSEAASALVTLPIHKAVLTSAGFPHPGHTEYLGQLAGPGHQPIMMLACPGLRVVPLTVHCALSDVPERLGRTPIRQIVESVHKALQRDFGIAKPRMVLAALNPHAGEDGTMGTEDRDLLTPIVQGLRQDGYEIVGPLPADTLFHAAARETYDVALCTYHDQALIPLKALDFFGGVNVTLGLPFIRTSPDHGTALSLAGTGNAHSGSLIAAIQTACSMAEQRFKATNQ